jgi:predicted RNase H-like nuclease
VKRLKGAWDFREVGLIPPGHGLRLAMEVFPAPARARLFALTSPRPYKKKRHRSWDQCREGLGSYIEDLLSLKDPALTIPDALRVNDEKGVALKSVEDQVDAVLCAYVAALAWLGKAECVGTLDDGYIVLPITSVFEGANARP